jgi:Domain of unknown function (DUF4375)
MKGRWPLLSIPNEEKVMRFVERFQSAVASGGFEGFFYADAGNDAQATLNALLVMKAIPAAALLRQAMWVFEGAVPPAEQNARREALRQIGETGSSVFRTLDGSFRRRNDELTISLSRYSQLLDDRCCVA